MKAIEYNEFYKQMSKRLGRFVFAARKYGTTLSVDDIDRDELESLLDIFKGKSISVETLDENSEISSAMIEAYITEFLPTWQDNKFMEAIRSLAAKTSVLYSAKIGYETIYILYHEQ